MSLIALGSLYKLFEFFWWVLKKGQIYRKRSFFCSCFVSDKGGQVSASTMLKFLLPRSTTSRREMGISYIRYATSKPGRHCYLFGTNQRLGIYHFDQIVAKEVLIGT